MSTFTERDWRTAHVLNQHRGKSNEYTCLGAVLCLPFAWDNNADCIAFGKLVDGIAIAIRMDEIRARWRQEARSYLAERGLA